MSELNLPLEAYSMDFYGRKNEDEEA